MPGVGHFSMSEIPGVFGKILPVFVSMRVVWKVSLSPPLDRKPYNRELHGDSDGSPHSEQPAARRTPHWVKVKNRQASGDGSERYVQVKHWLKVKSRKHPAMNRWMDSSASDVRSR